ncbi:MAG: protein-S-isoprenylcysteine O-methyltransferase [Bacteroidota bacterium]
MFRFIYWAGMLMQVIIRAPFAIRARSRAKTGQRVSRTENALLGLLTLSSLILPLIYSLTNWLAFADYTLPAWAGWAGVVILIFSLLIFLRSHIDLEAGWSPSLELYQGHALVTGGIYRHIRHPMYLSQLFWTIAQILLIQNWIAGPAGLLGFIPFYFLRSRAEEKMMLEVFGDRYQEYQQSTGGILPRL